MSTLRVCSFGRVSARRSQTLWHALAEGVAAGGPPTLSFMRPARPYVGLGYHRLAEEADLAWCAEAGLPVYRRRAGGGVVYLDAGQLFFQITVPAATLPGVRALALRHLLTPAVEAWRSAGVDARLDGTGEITVGDAKICGHAAAQIGDAVVVVGNLIETFDHGAAARVLALPPEGRAEAERLMRRFVADTPVDPDVFEKAAIAAYSEALSLDPVLGALSGREQKALVNLDRRFESPGWLAGPVAGRALPAARAVKIRSGVAVVVAEAGGARLAAGVVGGRFDRAHVAAPEWDGTAGRIAAGLEGLDPNDASRYLAAAGPVGRELAEALGTVRIPAD